MKKTLLTLAIVLLAMAAQAQIKIHDDGQVSIGSLTKNYGVQVRSDGFTTFRTQYSTSGSWATLSLSNNDYQKHWIVANHSNPNVHLFYVTGNGFVYKVGNWSRSDSRLFSETTNISNAGSVLDSITGLWYYPVEGNESKERAEHRIGVSAQEVEKVLI